MERAERISRAHLYVATEFAVIGMIEIPTGMGLFTVK